MARQVNFGLGKWRLKRFDGKGDVIDVFRTASSLVRAREDGIGDMELMAADACLHSAESQGLLKRLGLDLKGCDGPRERALRLLDTYSIVFVLLDDDGREIESGDDREPDPTSPR